MPPGYHEEWHIGVRVASNNKLVAFISGVPITVRVRKKLVSSLHWLTKATLTYDVPNSSVFRAVEINYLCVHKKLRSKRLAPVLIKEVTRKCHLKGIFQALYTAGVVLPTPVATCQYVTLPSLIMFRLGIPYTDITTGSSMFPNSSTSNSPTSHVIKPLRA